MKRNIVCNAVCTEGENYTSSAGVYLKNAVVSLSSVLGSDIERILLTNIRDIPDEFITVMNSNDIKIIFCPFLASKMIFRGG